jgi:hypothetical protein
MLRFVVLLVVGAVVVGLIARQVKKSRRRADATPDLHRHPERLDQMLDPTDDA